MFYLRNVVNCTARETLTPHSVCNYVHKVKSGMDVGYESIKSFQPNKRSLI